MVGAFLRGRERAFFVSGFVTQPIRFAGLRLAAKHPIGASSGASFAVDSEPYEGVA